MKLDHQEISLMFEKAEQASNLLKQLANPVRLLVLCHLTQGPMCVGDLEEMTQISQSSLSQHLAKLRHEHLVRTDKQGQHVYYYLANPHVEMILGLLYEIYCKPK